MPDRPDPSGWTRRRLLHAAGALGTLGGANVLLPSWARAGARGDADPLGLPGALRGERIGGADVFALEIAETPVQIAGRSATATTINGTLPGPLLRWREGQDTVLRVTNRLADDTSIHWHGVLVPVGMDGVPGVTFAGIRSGETFEYRFTPRQYGTYWYHSHSGLQEQTGVYAPLLIEPAAGRHPYAYDREYVLVLSDWTFADPHKVLSKLRKQPDYYNQQQRTLAHFARDVRRTGLGPTLKDRLQWSAMRMDPTDISDVTGQTYTFLLNGRAPASRWTGSFRPGERVLLHVINTASATAFDLRVPGLPLTVVQASGQYVQPVETDELRVAIAETYDLIVQPGDQPYAVFAEAMDRSGYALGALAPEGLGDGLALKVPPQRAKPVLTMADMGMDHGGKPGMDHGGPAAADVAAPEPGADPHAGHDPGAMDAGSMDHGSMDHGSMDHGSMDHGSMDHGSMEPGSMEPAPDAAKVAEAGAVRTVGLRPPGTLPTAVPHEPDEHGPGNAMVPMTVSSRLSEPGIGLGGDGWRVLRYTDLRALERRPEFRPPTREIEIHLTGNMERFTWSLDGVPFDRSEPLQLALGERVRLTMVNDTMMNHPMHLHGMWMELENGHGDLIPRVHTVQVKPAERLSVLIEPDEPGPWAFHCHVQYHMEVGMFRVFQVSAPGDRVSEVRRGG